MTTEETCESGLKLTPDQSIDLIKSIDFLIHNCGPASMRYESQKEAYFKAVHLLKVLKAQTGFKERFYVVK